MQNITIIKRLIISLAFAVIFAITGYIIYGVVTPDPSCSDNKQNQSEKGVDCGGVCSPCRDVSQTSDIVINEMAVALGGNNTFDVVGKITNPNDSFGTRSFEYEFKIKDASGNVIATRQGNNFILPADSKYVAELGLQMENGAVPSSAELVISDVNWEKLNDIGKPQIGVYNKNFGQISTGEGSQADGIIRNESGYDLNRIFIVVILRGEKGDIVGINKTEKNAVRTKEQRDFRLTWPYQLSGQVQSMDVDAQSNVFDPQNFSFSVR